MQVPRGGASLGPMTLIASVWREHGVVGFWHGQTGTLIRETGGSAAWFGSFEGMSLALRRGEEDLSIAAQLLAGASAGMAYNFAFYPADTVKSVMQTAGKGDRRGFWEVGRGIWSEKGLRGLYRGCGITVARSAPSSAFIFTVYERLKVWFA